MAEQLVNSINTNSISHNISLRYPNNKFRILKRIITVAQNTFREAVRDRILYNLVIFALLLTFASIFLGELSDSQEAKIITDIGLSSLLIFGVFISIFVGVGLVYKEIEKRTIYTIFAKPISRTEFLLGKYLGLCLTLAINTIIMGLGVSLSLMYVNGISSSLAITIWPTILLIFTELAITTAVAILFSSFSSPALSALLTFAIFIIGHFSEGLKLMAASTKSDVSRMLFTSLYYLLPNLSNYSFITPAAHGRVPSMIVLATSILYGIVYITILILISARIFNLRNFK
jgi:ABC-type transport system involved in multi-copper enzyme maturation permease subunit